MQVHSRTFDIDVFACVRCGGRRRLFANVKAAAGVRTVMLVAVGLGVRLTAASGVGVQVHVS
ncbi:hypothetical protein ACN28S_50415 [Cystobacter fuscus]